MKRIAIQLYTIKEEAKKDLVGTIKKMAEYGYQGVEFAGFYGVPLSDVKKALDDNNIVPVGIHLGIEGLKTKLDETIVSAKEIGCDTIVCPGVFGEDTKKESYFYECAEFFNKVGAICKENGIRFLYHVHGYEFERFNNKTGMDIIFDNTDQELVNFEIDTHWVEFAGVNAAVFYNHHKDRCTYLHFKDMNNRTDKSDTEVGEGCIEFDEILKIAGNKYSQWLIVEQEGFNIPPMESVQISIKNIKKMLEKCEQNIKTISKDKVVFDKKVIGELINDKENGAMNTFCTTGDLNNDGYTDFVVSGRNGEMVWFENLKGSGEWKKHHIDFVTNMECGGCTYDVDGDGYVDIINGSDAGHDEIYWWKNPGNTNKEWKKYRIIKTGKTQFHDVIVGDVKNDGNDYIVFTNQKKGTNVYCAKIPTDPTIEDWNEIELVVENTYEYNPLNYNLDPVAHQPEEGLAIGDVDGDGKNELVCGTCWYKYVDGKWERNKFCENYISTKVAVDDIDNDGENEIIVVEGDSYIYGKKVGGTISWFKKTDDVKSMWEEHIIDTNLLDGHSLQLADLCGNGNLDIFVGEIGAFDRVRNKYAVHPPRLMIYENDGKGNFPTCHVIDEGTGIHEALLTDLNHNGKLDIIGKPLHGEEKWNVHAYYRQK